MEEMDNNGNGPLNGEDQGPEKSGRKSRLAAIITKLKSSPVTAVAILSGAFVVLVAVVIAAVLFGRGGRELSAGNPLPATVIPMPEQKPLTYDELSKQIKLLFFEYNISKDSISESTDEGVDGAAPVHFIKVTASPEVAEPLRKDAVNLFSLNKIPLLYTDDIYHLVGDAGAFRAELLIERVKTAKPSPASATPATTGKNSFGLTPPKPGKGKIALLIDDAGMNLSLADRLTKLKVPMAVAILPHLVSSRDTADLVRSRGKTVFLHFPMEPLSYPSTDPGEGAVLMNMPEALIQAVSKSNVENLGKIDGFNNHMGSAITENETKIRQVLESMRPYTTIFVDSNTSNKSVAYSTCVSLGLSCGINRKFLDNSNEHVYIASKMYEAAELAEKQGGIITIGHLRPDTVTVLEIVIPELQKLGYQFVTVSSLTK